MKRIYFCVIFLLVIFVSVSCKRKNNENSHLVCYIFSEAEGDSYYMDIDSHGLMRITYGSMTDYGLITIEGEYEMRPNIDSLIGTVVIFDSIYDFKKHKWSYYDYVGNYYAQKKLSQVEFSKIQYYQKKMIDCKYDKHKSKRINANIYTKEDSVDHAVVPGIVLMFNNRTYSFRERDSLVVGMQLYKYLKTLSPMPIMIRPRHDCVSGEGSHTRALPTISRIITISPTEE